MIWVILHVEENGLLGVTQQFSNISSSYTSSNQHHQSAVTSQNVAVENPFSPRKLTTSLHATTTTVAPAALERPANFQPSAMGDNPFLTGSNNQPFPAGPVQHNFGASDGANGKCDMFCEPLSLSSAAAAAAGNNTTTTTTTTRGGYDSISRTLLNAAADDDSSGDVVITHYDDSNSCSGSASPRRPHNADYLLNVLNIPTADFHAAHAHAAHTAHGGGLPSSWPGTPTFSMVRMRNVLVYYATLQRNHHVHEIH